MSSSPHWIVSEMKNLQPMLDRWETLLAKTKDLMAKPTNKIPHQQEPVPVSPTIHEALHQYHEHPLEDDLLTDVHRHLKKLKYHPNPKSPKSPDILLYGSQQYTYNQQSANVEPIPIEEDAILGNLLNAVNAKLGASFNSVLINKYSNVNVSLGPHKDDESCIDTTSPIATLSLGATRRLLISTNQDKHKVIESITLIPRSIYCMLPGFQQEYYHSIAAGRRSIDKEKGIRFSITFRCLLPTRNDTGPPEAKVSVAAPPMITTVIQPTTTPDVDDTHPDTLVFGSSLTKGLDATQLSKYSRTFKVFPNRGAHISDIYEDIEAVRDSGKIDVTKIKCVLLICGGNDIENLKKSSDLKFLREDFEDIVDMTREAFPIASINIFSIIPRRSVYRSHIRNMHKMNEWLSDFCKKEAIRFVDIFSFFLYKTPTSWLLNAKLFNRSKLHFNATGDSVLAKVLIGVANRPIA